MTYRLAIDAGSSSVKIHAGEYDGDDLTFEEVARFDNATTWEDDRQVWDVGVLTDRLRDAIEDASDRYDDVDSVGIDATALDFGLLAEGELLRNPYFYRDPSLWSTAEEVEELFPERRAFHLTGYNLNRGPMHYQAKEAPELFKRADTLVPLPQLLAYELGAEPSTELTYAMTLQMFDLQSMTWANELIEGIGFPRHVLSDPVDPGTDVGSVDTVDTDLDDGPDIILPPSHDTAAAVGALPLSKANNAFLCTGSWFIPGLEVSDPIVTDEVFDIGGSNEIGVEDTVRFLRNLPGFSLLELCRDRWENTGKTYKYEPLLEAAADIDTDVPLIDTREDLFGDAQYEGDVEERIQTYCEQTDQTPPADEFETTACLLTSLAVNAAVVLDQLIEAAGETVEQIHLGGGGARNELFCQQFASAVDRPVHAGPIEATALGNLLVQMRSADEIEAVAEGREIIRKGFDISVYEPQHRTKWANARERLHDLAV